MIAWQRSPLPYQGMSAFENVAGEEPVGVVPVGDAHVRDRRIGDRRQTVRSQADRRLDRQYAQAVRQFERMTDWAGQSPDLIEEEKNRGS